MMQKENNEIDMSYVTKKVEVLEIIHSNHPCLMEKAKENNLKGNESHLIAFTKAGLSIAEQAKLLGVRKDSIRMIKMRIRAKLKINYRIDVIEYLEAMCKS